MSLIKVKKLNLGQERRLKELLKGNPTEPEIYAFLETIPGNPTTSMKSISNELASEFCITLH